MWIILFLLLLNAQSNELISHRFYCVTVSDFDLILYDLLYSLDFTGLLSESQSGFVIQVTHVVVLYVFMCCVLQFYRQHGPSTRLVETRARQHGPC